MRTYIVVIEIGIVLLLLPVGTAQTQKGKEAASSAQNDQAAREHFRLGRENYDKGSFLEAASEFEKAYEISRRPLLLYNLYLAYRDANQDRKAADALRRYLAEVSDIPNRGNLEARLAALDRAIAKQPAQPDESEDKSSDQPPSVPADSQDASVSSEPEGEDLESEPEPMAETSEGSDFPILPVVLMASGGAMLVGSLITGLMASSDRSDLESECRDGHCPPELESTYDRGTTLALITDVLWIGGLISAGAGLALFLLEGTSERGSDAYTGRRPAFGCGLDGCGTSIELSF